MRLLCFLGLHEWRSLKRYSCPRFELAGCKICGKKLVLNHAEASSCPWDQELEDALEGRWEAPAHAPAAEQGVEVKIRAMNRSLESFLSLIGDAVRELWKWLRKRRR